MAKNNGPRAFNGHEGISLRDYFAARAMTGYLISHRTADQATDNAPKCAEWAYIQADAMLAEREKES